MSNNIVFDLMLYFILSTLTFLRDNRSNNGEKALNYNFTDIRMLFLITGLLSDMKIFCDNSTFM